MKIFAGLPGLTTGYGGTHQAIEDLALMRMIPGLVVIDPCDATEIEQVVEAVAAHHGPTYCRLLRGLVPRVLDPAQHRFRIGDGYVLREGGKLGMISTGLMTERALDAADELAVARHRGLDPAHADDQAVRREASSSTSRRGVERIMTLENHVVVGGLGSLVAEALFEAATCSARWSASAFPTGSSNAARCRILQEKCGMTVPQIVARAEGQRMTTEPTRAPAASPR